MPSLLKLPVIIYNGICHGSQNENARENSEICQGNHHKNITQEAVKLAPKIQYSIVQYSTIQYSTTHTLSSEISLASY